ncbi:hypothetical protein E2P81_ATG06015 [Venturia nashicola]|nr:hypothetical protein E2P81_ATG06015 [Venturia nashicola]
MLMQSHVLSAKLTIEGHVSPLLIDPSFCQGTSLTDLHTLFPPPPSAQPATSSTHHHSRVRDATVLD